MITNVNKKVICVKDIPSNIIEEAIFILKTDVTKNQNEKIQKKRKEIITKEAESFLKDYIIQVQRDIDENDEQNDFKKLKTKIIIFAATVIIGCYFLFKFI